MPGITCGWDVRKLPHWQRRDYTNVTWSLPLRNMISTMCNKPSHFLHIVNTPELGQHICTVSSFQHPRALGEMFGVMNTIWNSRVSAPIVWFSTALGPLPASVNEPSRAGEGTTGEAECGVIPRKHWARASTVSKHPAWCALRKVRDQNGAGVHGCAHFGANVRKDQPEAGAGVRVVKSQDVHCFDESWLRGDYRQHGHHKHEELQGAMEMVQSDHVWHLVHAVENWTL